MSPSAKDIFAYGSIAPFILGINALAEDDALHIRSHGKVDYVYNGCLQTGMPLPSGVTSDGVSFYLAQVAYPREQTDDKLTEEQVPTLLRNLKRVLDLTTTDLANICGVSRPTIYAWLKGGHLDSGNLRRLEILSGLIQTWATRMNADLFSVSRVPESPELIQMLLSGTLDEPAIETILTSLVRVANAREATRPKTGREFAEEFGMEPLPEDMQERTVMYIKLGAGSGR